MLHFYNRKYSSSFRYLSRPYIGCFFCKAVFFCRTRTPPFPNRCSLFGILCRRHNGILSLVLFVTFYKLTFYLWYLAPPGKRHFSLVYCAILLQNCLYLWYLSLGSSQLLLSSVRFPREFLRIYRLAYQPINLFNHSQRSSS